MRTCILHVGMPKSGTSSIQSALYFSLDDPRFQYVSFGEINGSRGIVTLFGEEPESHLGNRGLAVTGDALARYRQRVQRRLARAIRRARRLDADLIISAEDGWHMTAAALTRLQTHFVREGYRIRVIVYLRPWLSWLASSLQEQIKYGLSDLAAAVTPERLTRCFDYVSRLEKLAQVFGSDNVECHPYSAETLRAGCVVRDFFHRIGSEAIHPPHGGLNPTLSAEACKLLYHHNRHDLQGRHGRFFFARHARLLGCLAHLGGPPFRLHPSVVNSMEHVLEHQQRLLFARHGIRLPLDLDHQPAEECIRNEHELLSPSPSTLEWLQRVTGRRSLSASDVADRPRCIAEMVATLAHRFGPVDYARWLGSSLHRNWRHVTSGV